MKQKAKTISKAQEKPPHEPRLGNAVVEISVDQAREIAGYLTAASAESLEAMRDAERLRALQADIDKPPHESRFSLYEYGTKVFAVRRCLDFEIKRAIEARKQMPAEHAPGCGVFGGDAHKRGPDVCDCAAERDALKQRVERITAAVSNYMVSVSALRAATPVYWPRWDSLNMAHAEVDAALKEPT